MFETLSSSLFLPLFFAVSVIFVLQDCRSTLKPLAAMTKELRWVYSSCAIKELELQPE